MAIVSINPATGETLQEFEVHDKDELERRIARAARSFHSYRRTSYHRRGEWLSAAAKILEDEKEALGWLMAQEMGKLMRAGADEAAKCALACRYYAENGARLLADEAVAIEGTRSFVRYQPLGPVLAVMPWNFPFWQVFRFAAPALMAGNVILLKHASNVPRCALAIEDLLLRAGFPEGVFQTLFIPNDRVDGVLGDDRVVAATLTGSIGAGRAVATSAAQRIKKVVLELGGSDPFIVMPSADIPAAAATAVKARIVNNGQSCIAAKRFLVHRDVAEEFERLFVEGMRRLRVGDPLDPATELGPLATRAQLDTIVNQVEQNVGAGARVLTGGSRIGDVGFFYAPTVLTDIEREFPAYREEIFGPVALLFRVRDLDHAIHLANDVPFGLGASVWTSDFKEHERFIDELEVGMVFVNAMVVSDPRLPFGGVKESGYGRELGTHGIREFVNVKAVKMLGVE